jgi:hypothetical protein
MHVTVDLPFYLAPQNRRNHLRTSLPSFIGRYPCTAGPDSTDRTDPNNPDNPTITGIAPRRAVAALLLRRAVLR